MLKSRVLTAAVIAPLFVLGVFYLPASYFALLTGVVVVLAAWEWTGLSGYRGTGARIAAVIVVVILMLAAHRFHVAAEPLLVLTCVLWLAVAAALFHRRRRSLLEWPAFARWISGAWVLVPAWLALGVLQDAVPTGALLLLILVWAADTGAYFIGRRWGRRKLAPAISPGKTLEGVCGGMLAAAIVGAGFGILLEPDVVHWLGLVVWSAVIALISVCGDLFESNWKRLADVKDSGGLLPGHGGVLDRIDSATSAAPFFALGWLWWFGCLPA